MPEGHQGQQFVVHKRTQAVLEKWKMEATVTLLMHSGKATGELYNQPKPFYWKVGKKIEITKQHNLLKSTIKISKNLKPVTLSA